MNLPRFLTLVTVLTAAFPLCSSAQVLSARRLTQRVAPQTAPQPAYPAQPAPGPAAPVVHAPLAPAKSLASGTGTNFTEVAEKPSEEAAPAPQPPPATVECKKVQMDPRDSLQSIMLSLTNSSPKPISYLTMRLIYQDANGKKLKEWTTRRELDPTLAPNSTTDLEQPAYFMPLLTKQVKVELESARFADGAQWSNPALAAAAR